jgi:hypothetical protein
MSFYPQIGSGVVTQFPFARTRMWRAVTNQMESGELITLPDTAGGQIAWSLKYQDLTTAETAAISTLFTASQGQFGSFTFIDPMANLLGWSEDFTQAGWQLGQMTTAAGVADPLGTRRASAVSNSGAAAQPLSQTLGVSGDYVACFSAYVRANSATTVTMQRDNTQTVAPAGPQWTRVLVSGTGIAGAAHSTFSLVIPAGQTIDVFGVQVEVQPWPSVYRQTSAASGIYSETYFADDELTMTSTGLCFSRAAINLISRQM